MTNRKKISALGVGACCLLLLLAGTVFADPQAAYRAGRAALDRGDTAGAEAAVGHLKTALTANPYYTEALRALGEAYVRLEMREEARLQLERALAQDPRDASTALLAAENLVALGRAQGARVLLDRVLAAEPRNPRALLVEARYYRVLRRADLALPRLAAVKQLVPDHPEACIETALIHEERKQWDAAERELRKAWNKAAVTVAPNYQLGRFYYSRGKISQAREYLEKALQLDPEHRPSLRLLAPVRFLSRNWQGAFDAYGVLTRADPHDFSAHLARAQAAAELARETRSWRTAASSNYRAALRLRSNDETARYDFEEFAVRTLPVRAAERRELSVFHAEAGESYAAHNQLREAVASLRRSIRIDPLAARPRRQLILLHERLKYWESAFRDLGVLQELEPDNLRIRDRLEYYRQFLPRIPSRKESVKQFEQPPSDPRIVVFDLFAEYNTYLRRFGTGNVIAAVLRDALAPSDRLRLVRLEDHRVANQAEAWRRARAAGSDYYVHGRFIPGEDFTVIEAFLHSTASGEQLTNLRISRRGNRQVFEAAVAIAGRLEAFVPQVGRILRLSGDRVMVNLGMRHGLSPGAVFSVSGDAAFRSALLAFRPALRLVPVGEITIDQVDEVVSFGTVTSRGTFDGVAQYQYVVPKVAARTNAGGAR